MAYGRGGYLLGRDIGISGRGLRETQRRSQKQQGGINLFRGIGRGLGMLGGIALAGTGAGVPLLALAGGLGSLGGSLAGRELGKKKYGDVEKANVGLFNRDIAREQRRSVGDYWRGMKEQIGVNALQDAITAGMYGSQIQKFAGMGKPMAAPMTPNVPISAAAQPQMLGDEALSLLDMTNKTQMPTTTASIGGVGAGIDTTASAATGIDPFNVYDTAVSTTSAPIGGTTANLSGIYRGQPDTGLAGIQGGIQSDLVAASGIDPSTLNFQAQQAYWGDIGSQMSPRDPRRFLNQAAGGGQPTAVQQSYGQPYLQQILQKSKYFGGG